MPIAPMPGRPRWRPGVPVFVPALAVALTVTGCEAVGGGAATIQLDTGEVRLESGAELHEVTIAGAAGVDSIAPSETRARAGDAIRFTSGDHRLHALLFDGEALTGPIREYLRARDQLRAPPLVNEGASWIVVLDDAPAGRYPFVCLTHGSRGVVLVGAAD